MVTILGDNIVTAKCPGWDGQIAHLQSKLAKEMLCGVGLREEAPWHGEGESGDLQEGDRQRFPRPNRIQEKGK